ncbi:MFS transporter [Granulicella aggregans]|uniref:MFS transporter n=1 Tax=Granulicella aggregans TaxID=474949 RepID=UPI0021E068FF|nr:MFS transporter [Granulicella aggregans]
MVLPGVNDSAELHLSSEAALGQRTLRKAAWRLIPLLSVCYMVAFMDRANISFAALQMNRDLHFNAGIYGFGAGVFFLSYAICELPSNLLLLKFGARRWIARIMLTWGILAAAMMFVRSPLSFYVLRFLLGMAEAGFFPGVLYYLSLWFPQEMRSRAVGRFYIAFPLSNVLMGLIAGSLLSLNGRLGLKGWQWLFLVEAIPAILLSVVVWNALPDGPADARWMEPEERAWLLARLREDAAAIERAGGKSGHHADVLTVLLSVLMEPRVALIGVYMFLSLGSYYAFSFSAPAIYQAATGWGTNRVGALIAGIALGGAAGMLIVCWHSDRIRAKVPYVVGLSLLTATAFAVSGLVRQPWVMIAALGLASVSYYASQGPALSLSTTFLDGPAAAVGIAAINMLSIIGGFVGPNWMGWAIQHGGGTRVGTGMLSIAYLLAAVVILVVSLKTGRGQVSIPPIA